MNPMMPMPSLAVTVIIPMRNEERRIGRCLESIMANDFPQERMEILVVDGMSDDRSAGIAAEYSGRFPIIRVVENRKRIVPAGLNLGILQARGEVIIIMGAHCEYPHKYISTCVSELERTQANVVGGMLNTRPGADTLIARAIALMTQHPFGVGGSAFRTRSGNRYVDTVPYGAYRRDVFETVGIFDEHLARNQDFEFNARVRRAGGKLFLSADIEVDYYNAADFKRLVSQAFQNGLWLARMWMVSPASFRLRHAVPLAFVSVLLLSGMLGLLNSGAMQFGTLVLSIYLLAAAVCAIQIARRESSRFFLPLVGLFFAHHVAYGLGTLTGVVKAVCRRTSGTSHMSPSVKVNPRAARTHTASSKTSY
jgi:glycosyltransferase involved in cell wall biosynthesis